MSATFWPSPSASFKLTQKPQRSPFSSLGAVEEEGEDELQASSSSSSSCSTPPSAEKTVQCYTPPPPPIHEKKQENQKPLPKGDSELVKSGNIFRISIQENFDKLVDLPNLCVWDRLESPVNFLRGRLAIQIRAKGFLIRRETGWMACHCLISRQGHLIVYSKEKHLKGYAVNLSRAKKLQISCGKVLQEKKDTEKAYKKYCLLRIKWKFGSVSINLLENQINEWRQFILDAYEQNWESHPFSCTLSHSLTQDESKLHVKDDDTPKNQASMCAAEDKDSVCITPVLPNRNGSSSDHEMFTRGHSIHSEKITRSAEHSTSLTSVNVVRRRHSEAAWMHSKSRYRKEPIPEWADDFGSANRFRLTREYFENYGRRPKLT